MRRLGFTYFPTQITRINWLVCVQVTICFYFRARLCKTGDRPKRILRAMRANVFVCANIIMVWNVDGYLYILMVISIWKWRAVAVQTIQQFFSWPLLTYLQHTHCVSSLSFRRDYSPPSSFTLIIALKRKHRSGTHTCTHTHTYTNPHDIIWQEKFTDARNIILFNVHIA